MYKYKKSKYSFDDFINSGNIFQCLTFQFLH